MEILRKVTLCWNKGEEVNEVYFSLDKACLGFMDNLEFIGFKWANNIDGSQGKVYRMDTVRV